MNTDRFKFRAWDTVEKVMYHSVYLINKPDSYPMLMVLMDDGRRESYHSLAPSPTIIPIQCTGLRDSNNTLIYEGDIVKQDDRDIGAPRIFIGEVYYNTDYCLCTYPGFAAYGKYGQFALSPATKVIGNIYEHPELLEKE